MQKFMQRTLFTAMFMASAIAGAAESGFVIGAEYNMGGAKVYPDPDVISYPGTSYTYTDQKTQVDLREGENTTLKLGYDWLIGDSLAIRGTVGYAWASEKMNDTKTSHVPVELMFFYRNNNHRFGVGPVLHLQRKVESTFSYVKATPADSTTTPATAATSIPYRTSTSGTDSIGHGLKFEYDYEPSWGQGLYFGLQYTYMRYNYDQKQYIWQGVSSTGYQDAIVWKYSGNQNSSSGGVTIGYRF